MINKLFQLMGIGEVFIILIVGLYFTFKLKFLQFNIPKLLKGLVSSQKNNNYSPLSLLLMVLGGRIGVGSIAGVALAIYIGGPGSIFWLLFSSLITAILTYIETIIGHIYKEKEKGVNYGGPSYYLEKGLNKRVLGIIYAILVIFCYILGFISIQANTIVRSLQEFININPLLIAIILGIITFYIIVGGLKKIMQVSNIIVVLMLALYLGLTINVIIVNIEKIPSIISLIFNEAFNLEAVTGGIISSIIVGIQRGIFANEAGLGTGSMATSISDDTNMEKQGYLQIIGVYITTFIVCMATSIIILTSDYNFLIFKDLNGIEIVQYAYLYHFGMMGNIILFIFVFLFALSTIITCYYYGEASIRYILKKESKSLNFILKIITSIIVVLGCLVNANILWIIVDIFIFTLVLINIYALVKLRLKLFYHFSKNMIK